MKKLIPILFLITLSFNLFSQVEDDNLFNIFLGNKSLLEEKDLLMLYPNKSTKMFIGTNEKKYSFYVFLIQEIYLNLLEI